MPITRNKCRSAYKQTGWVKGRNAPIGSSTAQHLVDPDNVEGVGTNTEMERILSAGLGDVFVGTDTGGFESLG